MSQTPESQKEKAPETPKTPRPAKSPKQFSIEEIKAKMQATKEKVILSHWIAVATEIESMCVF